MHLFLENWSRIQRSGFSFFLPGIITCRFVQEQNAEMINMGFLIAPFFWMYYTGLLIGNLIAYAVGR